MEGGEKEEGWEVKEKEVWKVENVEDVYVEEDENNLKESGKMYSTV